jgi:hypothetical protein
MNRFDGAAIAGEQPRRKAGQDVVTALFTYPTPVALLQHPTHEPPVEPGRADRAEFVRRHAHQSGHATGELLPVNRGEGRH